MSTVPADKRSWKCPECGGEVLLSVTQLDPIACEACLARMKRGKADSSNGITEVVAGPLGTWRALPEMTKLGMVVVALIIGLLIGVIVGFVAGQSMPSHEVGSKSESTHTKDSSAAEEPEERPPAPGPGYKWVRGRIRKDGTRPPGHWAKDPLYRGDREASEVKSK